MDLASVAAFAVFFVACFGAALTGAFFSPGAWYERLEKPGWTPPNWAFPVVWTVLYILIAIAGWRVWDAAGTDALWPALTLWGTQLVLNALWSPAFFGLRRPDLAMLVVLGMWGSIAGTIAAFLAVDATAAWMMAPYLLWTTIAAALNLWIWRHNPRAWEITA